MCIYTLFVTKMKKLTKLFTLLVFLWSNFLTPISYAQNVEIWNLWTWNNGEKNTEITEELENVEQNEITNLNSDSSVENLSWDKLIQENEEDIKENEEIFEMKENFDETINIGDSTLRKLWGTQLRWTEPIKTAILLPWMDFNKKVKTLANWREESYWNIDYNVLQIVESEYEAPEWANAMNLASVHSDYPVYFWYDSWIVYYHAEADVVYFNEDCRYMFSRFNNLKMIDIAKIDNSRMTNIDDMFAYSENLKFIISSDFSFRNSWRTFSDDYNLVWQRWTEYKWWRGIYALVDNATHSWYFWWDYVVMFDSNWWDEVVPQVFSVWGEYNIQEPNTERENSIFKWWYTVGWQKWNFNDIVTKPTILYGKWECEDWYLMSIDGNSCVSMDTITIDSVDWGKITIMKEDIWVAKNWWWSERDQWPCPAWYHVPTMQEWNTLFVSRCENHTILWDGMCDVRELDRKTWEYERDFIYTPQYYNNMDRDVLSNELNLKLFEPGLYYRNPDLFWVAYWTSTPSTIGGFLDESYFYVVAPSVQLDPLFWSITNELTWLSVRCFADNYQAPNKMVLLDLIDKEDLDEYNEFEQKVRSWEIGLPDEKIEEMVLLMAMDGQPKNSILSFLIMIDYEIEYTDNDEDKEYLQELKVLLEKVVNVTDDNKNEIINEVNSFGWREDLYWELRVLVERSLWIRNRVSISNQEFEENIMGDIQDIKQMVDELLDTNDCFTDFDKETMHMYIDDLENARSNDDVLMFLHNLVYGAEDLLDQYENEIWQGKVSRYKNTFEFMLSMVETSLTILELDEFINEARDYLWTDNWIKNDGTLDYQEMVTQEYLQEEFAKMWYRVMLTSEMSANDIRGKIASIKWITLENDEYLALFDVNQEEINIDRWINHYERWYVEPKKIKKEDWGWQSGWWWHWWGDWWNKHDPKDEDKDHWSADDENDNPDKNQEPTEDSKEDSPDKDPKDWKTPKTTPQELNMDKYDDTYSEEFNRAYQFSYSNNITTKWSIKEAQMYWNLTRIQMAKMLSQYAINVMWKQPNKNINNQFNDVSDEQNSKYDDAVTLSYQLWIMWQNMPNNKFRPNDEVTRAEFVAAFSRMVYNTSDGEFKSTSKYYTNHMEKLKNEWIITIFNPSMKERRWYVMIMLMRSAE